MELNNRINRIIGQLKGIDRMVDEKRDCTEILQQISAVKKAIDGLAREMVVSSICKNVSRKDRKGVGRLMERAMGL